MCGFLTDSKFIYTFKRVIVYYPISCNLIEKINLLSRDSKLDFFIKDARVSKQLRPLPS